MWPDKVDYSLSTPTKAVIFGTTVQVDFRLIPLLKGLKIGKIVTELKERQEVSIKPPRAPKKRREITRLVTKDEYCLAENVEPENIGGQEGYVFSRTLSIPQNLRKCLQSVDALGIRIRHSLHFTVQMHNPDEHVSEVSANLSLKTMLITHSSYMQHFHWSYSSLRTCPSMMITTWYIKGHRLSMLPRL